MCILAGGLGTRLGRLVSDTPKPLLRVAGQPFLLHQLRLLASYGAALSVICVGYLGERIVSEIGYERFGVTIAYSHDGPQPAGTLGAIRNALPLLGDRFMVLYGDTYLRIDYRAFARSWLQSGLPAGMAVLRNRGRWGLSNAVYSAGIVSQYDKHDPSPAMCWIDYGLGGLTAEAIASVPPEEPDLAVLYRSLAEEGKLFGFAARHRFYEIGTPEALSQTTRFLRTRSR